MNVFGVFEYQDNYLVGIFNTRELAELCKNDWIVRCYIREIPIRTERLTLRDTVEGRKYE